MHHHTHTGQTLKRDPYYKDQSRPIILCDHTRCTAKNIQTSKFDSVSVQPDTAYTEFKREAQFLLEGEIKAGQAGQVGAITHTAMKRLTHRKEEHLKVGQTGKVQ